MSDLRPLGFAAIVRQACDQTSRQGAPMLQQVRFPLDASKRDYIQLLMPLSNDAGEVSTIWAVMQYCQSTKSPARIRGATY